MKRLKYLLRPFKSIRHVIPRNIDGYITVLRHTWYTIRISKKLFNKINRKQYVEIEDTKSKMLDISTGVPQGSIIVHHICQ